MTKISFALMLLIVSSATFAQGLTCLDKLLPFSKFSGQHYLSKEEWSNAKEQLDPESALSAFNALIGSKLMCKATEVSLNIQPTCSKVISDVEQSYVCFIFSNVGYFFVSQDKAKNINFIFSKDKKFGDK